MGVQTESALGIKVCVELRLIAMYKGVVCDPTENLQSLFRYLRLIAHITVVLNPSVIPVITPLRKIHLYRKGFFPQEQSCTV